MRPFDRLRPATAFFGAAMNEAMLLGLTFGRDRECTLRARYRKRFFPGGIVALRPAAATVENTSEARLFLNELSAVFDADRAGDTSRYRSCLLAVRIVGTGEELSELAALDGHRFSAR